MTTKQFTPFLYVIAFFLTLALGTATASPILIGTTQTLTLDDNYPLKNSKARNDNSFNVNWLADHYTPDPSLSLDLPLNLTILDKYETGNGWGNAEPYFNVTFDSDTKTSGSWELVNLSFTGPIYLSIKASDEFALYYANGLTTYSWNTSDINDKLHDMSHITFWTAEAANQVPEPSTIILFGLGCIGLAGIGRKQAYKN